MTDYRSVTTGISESDLYSGSCVTHLNVPSFTTVDVFCFLADAWAFNVVQQYVANLIKGKVLVGHGIWNDLSVLGIPHPAVSTRDVALYQPFRNALRSPHQIIGLQTLAWQLLCRRCQEGQLHPLENARVALDLYRSHADEWESAISKNNWPCALPPSTFSRCYL